MAPHNWALLIMSFTDTPILQAFVVEAALVEWALNFVVSTLANESVFTNNPETVLVFTGLWGLMFPSRSWELSFVQSWDLLRYWSIVLQTHKEVSCSNILKLITGACLPFLHVFETFEKVKEYRVGCLERYLISRFVISDALDAAINASKVVSLKG